MDEMDNYVQDVLDLIEWANGDIIIKLVNLLPVAIHCLLKLKDIILEGCSITKTVLNGEPDDEQVQPVSSKIELKEDDTFEMPAYSFSVIRIAAAAGKKE